RRVPAAPRPDFLLRPGTSNSLEHGEWFVAAKCRAQSEWGPGAAGLADRGNRGCSSVSFYCMKHNCELCVNTFLHFPLCGYSETGGGQGPGVVDKTLLGVDRFFTHRFLSC